MIALALASCGQSGEDAAPPPGSDNAIEPRPAEIPEPMRGAWGMSEADCANESGVAAGMIEISSGSIQFYESTAQLESIAEAGEGSVRATFAFTGEGETWQREMRLDLRESGQALVRSDFGEDAIVEPMQYRRCAD